jgi:DNA-binding SARP family transcriptional activator
LVEALWPELDDAAGHQNLRVTMTYLRRVLEPDREPTEACFQLRSDSEQVWLHRSPSLVVDLWELERGLVAARRHRSADSPAPQSAIDDILALWRGSPLPDLQGIELGHDHAARLTTAYLTAVLDAAEADVAYGRYQLAAERAGAALELDPFCERAHRLAIVAQLDRGHLDEARAAARHTIRALAELKVSPEPSTAVLLRRIRRVPAA